VTVFLRYPPPPPPIFSQYITIHIGRYIVIQFRYRYIIINHGWHMDNRNANRGSCSYIY
jgi:hypothetical protein